MSNRIEGSSQSVSQFNEVQNDAATKADETGPMCAVNRVETAKVEERDFAESNPLSRGAMTKYLDGIPVPGAAELEVRGYVDHNGGKLKAEVERTEDGQFRVKIGGSGQLGAHAGIGVNANVGGAKTWVVRTPEAAADLLASLAAARAPIVGEIANARLTHYEGEALRQSSVSLGTGASLGIPLPTIKGELEAKGEWTATIDRDKRALVIESAVTGEAIGRFGILIAGGGLEGEVSGRVRTEIAITPEMLEKYERGQLSLRDLAQGVRVSEKVILEAKGRGEITNVFAPKANLSTIVVAEAEIDLDKVKDAIANPERAPQFLHGHRKTYIAKDVVGDELQMMVVDAKVQLARYAVSETPLFHHDHPADLQKELDGKRLTNTVPH